MVIYIDPGTGSMLFAVLFSVFGVVFYFLRGIVLKLKVVISGGRDRKLVEKKLPMVIFSDDKRYWTVFKPVCDELEKRGIDTVYMTASDDDPVLEEKYEHIESKFTGRGNKTFAALNVLNARIVLSTTPSLDVFQWKRSKNVDYYIHIPHAASDITLYRMFGIDYYDAVLLSGEYQVRQVRQLEKLRNLKKKDVELVGIPYMDVMLERISKDREKGGTDMTEEKEKTVLVAPSWGEGSLLALYGEKLLDALLDTGHRIVVRPHPQSWASEKDMLLRLQKKYGERLEWNRDSDNYGILLKSDVMISDFSGVIFDYALVFDRPVIYTAKKLDKAPYDAAWIDDELWTYQILPQIGVEFSETMISDIKNVIDGCADSEELKKGRDRARRETWCHMGEGAVRTANFIEEKLKSFVQID